jgi:hypothetical protein
MGPFASPERSSPSRGSGCAPNATRTATIVITGPEDPMPSPQTVTQFDPGLPATYAFRIDGAVDKESMSAMSHTMLDAFDRHDMVDMLLVFEGEVDSETGASFTMEAVKSRVKSLTNVRNYVVAGGTERARDLLETMDVISPVNAETFKTEAEALDWLRAQTPLG